MRLLARLRPKRRAAPPVERVAIRTGSVVTEVGAAAILHGLFSTISANLEPAGRGTRFPVTMNRLYSGSVTAADARAALDELRIIETELSAVSVDRVVWDIDDRSVRPNPHYRPRVDARNAADYFVTVNGLDLLRAGLIESLESAVEFGHDVSVVTFTGPADFYRQRT
jgi:hypothetical protein